MNYYVYILTNKNNSTLYIGITSNLPKRIFEHKNHLVKGFSDNYKLEKLVYFETHESVEEAILREKRLKKWNRAWKEKLINKQNPEWRDMYEQIV